LNLVSGTSATWTFLGWTTTTAGLEEGMLWSEAVSDGLITAPPSTMPEGGLGIYGMWGNDDGEIFIPNNGLTITYRAGTGATGAEIVDDVIVGQYILLRAAPATFMRTGHHIIGWNTAADGTGTAFALSAAHTVAGNLVLYAQWAVNANDTPQTPQQPPVIADPRVPTTPFIQDHIWYIQGYPDGSVRPESSITRAEISMILWRLLDSNAKHAPQIGRFVDVQSFAWYAQAVNYLANRDVLRGYPDGTFRPDNPVTRAELTAIMSRFFDLDNNGVNNFSDVEVNHWAVHYINNAHNRGWVTGFGDGTFRPNNSTTRAEAVTIVNRVLGRFPNPATINYQLNNHLYELVGVTRLFNDITNAHWAFYQIMEAAIEHEYYLDVQDNEVWIEIFIPWWFAR